MDWKGIAGALTMGVNLVIDNYRLSKFVIKKAKQPQFTAFAYGQRDEIRYKLFGDGYDLFMKEAKERKGLYVILTDTKEHMDVLKIMIIRDAKDSIILYPKSWFYTEVIPKMHLQGIDLLYWLTYGKPIFAEQIAIFEFM